MRLCGIQPGIGCGIPVLGRGHAVHRVDPRYRAIQLQLLAAEFDDLLLVTVGCQRLQGVVPLVKGRKRLALLCILRGLNLLSERAVDDLVLEQLLRQLELLILQLLDLLFQLWNDALSLFSQLRLLELVVQLLDVFLDLIVLVPVALLFFKCQFG